MWLVTRRRFCTLSLSSLLATVGCGTRSTKSTTNAGASELPFTGSVRGEQFQQGHLMRDGQLPTFDSLPTDSNIYDYVIVGSGLSGLSLAYKLNKLGITNGLLLDKEPVPGGLCRGETSPLGLRYGIGAHYMDYPQPGNEHVIELLRDCGVIASIQPNGWPLVHRQHVLNPEPNNIFVNGRWQPGDLPEALCTDHDDRQFEQFQMKCDQLSRFRDQDGRSAFGYPLRDRSTDPAIVALDRISMSDWLKQHGLDSKVLAWYCNMWLVDEYGCTIENTSAWAALHFFRDRQPPDDMYHASITFPEGLGYLTSRLVQHLQPDQIRTQCWGMRIEDEGELAAVVYYDQQSGNYHRIRCRFAIAAVPKHQLPYMMPQLPEEQKTAYRQLRYSPWVVANVHLKSLPDYGDEHIRWDNTIYDSWTLGYIHNQFTDDSPPSPNQPHVWSLYACFADDVATHRSRILQLTWEQWAEMFVVELEKAHPEIRSLISHLDVWVWGHPMRQPTVNSLWHGNRQQLQQPIGPISFCHVDTCGLPVAEEAIDQAFEHAIWLANRITAT